MKRDGFSTIEFIITLMVLTFLAAAAGFFVNFSNLEINRKKFIPEEKNKIDSILNEIYEDIKKTAQYEFDSRNSPVWKKDKTEKDGYRISIQSLSKNLNLNFCSERILLDTNIQSFFSDQEGIRKITQIKKEGKLISSFEEISECITEENYENYFTIHGFANINASDDAGLSSLISKITNQSFADDFINKRSGRFFHRQYFKTDSELRMFCGVYYDELYPFVNLNPQLNVNYIEEDLLKELLMFPEFNITGVNQKVASIVSLRDSTGVSETDLHNILGISDKNELYWYLGCKTWVWQVIIGGEKLNCRIIIYRAPSENNSGEAKFYLTEKSWF